MIFAHRVSRRSFVRIAGASVLATALLGSGVALAADPQASSSDKAVQLVDRPLSGHLDGNSGGSFAYYKFDYPADGSTATVNVQMTPDDPIILQNAGIVIFGVDGSTLVTGGQQPHLQPNVSGNVIFSDPNKKGTYVVQVFNYNPQTAVDFEISVTGVTVPSASAQPTVAPVAPPAPAPAPVVGAPAPAVVAPAAPAAPAPQPAPSPTPQPSTGQPGNLQGANSFNGHLDAGGKTALYEFTYPGDQSVYTVGLQISPEDPTILQNAGFKVYGPTKDKVYVQGGAQPGIVPNVAGNLISTEAGTYVIQVYNYSTAPIDYTVSLQTNAPPGEVLASQKS